MSTLTISKAVITANSQRDITTVFVDGYYDLLSMLCPDKEKLIAALAGGFNENVFYIAYLDGKPVGISACSYGAERALRLDKDRLCDAIGEEIGTSAYENLRGEFHPPLTYPDNTAYIECVAIVPEAQGKGVATKLMKYILENAPYSEYILEVADTNAAARKVYEKL